MNDLFSACRPQADGVCTCAADGTKREGLIRHGWSFTVLAGLSVAKIIGRAGKVFEAEA